MHEAFVKVVSAFTSLQNQITLLISPVLGCADFSTLFPYARKRRDFFDHFEGFLLHQHEVAFKFIDLIWCENVFDDSVAFDFEILKILLYAAIFQTSYCGICEESGLHLQHQRTRSHSLYSIESFVQHL